MNEYTPGICNLGKDEVQRRYSMGWKGLIALILLMAGILIVKPDRLFRLLVFIPLYYALSGFIQGYYRFCFVYGYLGLFSLKALRQVTRVTDPVSLRKDRMTALKMVAWITLISGFLTLLFYRV